MYLKRMSIPDEQILEALKQTDYSQVDAAVLLGMKLRSLAYRIKRMRLKGEVIPTKPKGWRLKEAMSLYEQSRKNKA